MRNRDTEKENDFYEIPDSSNEVKVDDMADKNYNSRIKYVWIEAFFCLILLIGILIIQNVKNTEELQLRVRQEIRHNLTANELVNIGENLKDMMQKYKDVTP